MRRPVFLSLLLFLTATSLFAQDWRGGRPDRRRDRDRYGYRDNYFDFAVDAGVANLDTDVAGTSSANRFAASAAIGLKFPIANNVAVKIEERGFFANTGDNGDRCRRFDCNDTNLYQGETSLGVSFRF